MAKAVLTFALYQGDALQRRETVTQDIVKVGKDPKSHLRVDDDQASRMHAVIEVAGPEDITLIDLGNEPGTMVNGARVNKCKLHVGDQIQVGQTYIVLESADAAGAEAVAAPQAAYGAPAPAANPFAPAAGASPFAAASNPFEVRSANPFAAGAAAAARQQALHVAEDAPPGTYTYTMIKSGPDVSADEVEIPHLQSVEVMVLWGANVLHVSHLTPPRNFYVGEEQGKNFACDFFIPSEKLGTTRLPVVIGDRASVAVVIPPGARGSVELPGMPRMTMDEARARAQPTAEVSGGHQLNLPSGGKARVEVGDFVFQVAAVNAGKPIQHGVGTTFDWNVAMYFGLSLAAIGGLVAAMAFFVPPLGLTDDEDLDKDALYLMQQYLKSAAEREQEEKEAEVVQDNSDNKEGGTGTRAKGEEGSMGNPTTKAVNKRYAVQGPKDNPDPHIARQAALREAMEFGMIGLLNTGAAGDPNAPTAPWGRDTSLGTDDVSARGNMWGDEIGDAFGAGGLGLSGIGEGGGRDSWSRSRYRHRSGVRCRSRSFGWLPSDDSSEGAHGRNNGQRSSAAGSHSAHRAPELRPFPHVLRAGFEPQSEPRRSRFGALRDRSRRRGLERIERWVGSSGQRRRELRDFGLLRPELPAARRRHRHGRVSDHALAGLIALRARAATRRRAVVSTAARFRVSRPMNRQRHAARSRTTS
jgi:hypothetical protein